MSRYARILNGKVLEYRQLDAPPPNRLKAADYKATENEDGDTVMVAARPGTAPSKPYFVPFAVLKPNFNPVSQVLDGPTLEVSDIDVVERYTARPKNADEIEAMRSAKIAAIKAEAAAHILAIMPAYQQTNAIALGLEMTTTYGSDPGNWPAEARAVYEATLPKWQAIKAIRERSNELERSVPHHDPCGIDGVNPADGWL